MKNPFLVLMLILVFSSIVLAGTPNESILATFNQMFTNATNVKWSKENKKEWEAEFWLYGTKVSANFLNDGSWVETETEIAISQLPVPIIDYIKSNHPGHAIKTAFKIESAAKSVTFECEIYTGKSTKEIVLTENGAPVK